LQINYRFLSPPDFNALHAAMLEAFSDYIIPFRLSETQFENHIAVNAVDINRSVGAFINGKMVGFTLNGFGLWNGKSTVYDAGTGVVPAFRGKGVAAKIFDFMLPALRRSGGEQILLEVITENEKAARLYRKMDFRETRRLLLFERQKSPDYSSKTDFIIREISAPDWELLKTFWDGKTCWQNSIEAFKRSLTRKIVFGAFRKETCVGYGVVYLKSGNLAQIAVDKNYRRRGVASRLLSEMQKAVGENKPLRAGNVDENLKCAVDFLKNRSFTETLSQFEMIKTL
jgi:ribosomal protein S18 acetylase RimI-like enzyme